MSEGMHHPYNSILEAAGVISKQESHYTEELSV